MIKRTNDEIISSLIKTHSDKYDYSLVNYESWDKPIIIICPIHNRFLQRYNVHKSGGNCPKCAAITRGKSLMISKEKFVEKANIIHNNIYNYDNSIYNGYHRNIDIICKKHGLFSQMPLNHLKGAGCNKCALERTSFLLTKDLNKFIQQSNIIHNYKYTYDNTIYIADKTPLIITCKIHGDFLQRPGNHLVGKGCPLCGNIRCSIINKLNSSTESLKKNWLKKADKYNHYKGIFYIIKCYNDSEEFYKYGITYKSIKERYRNNKTMPYQYDIIKTVESFDLNYIWELEKRFGKYKLKNRYKPLIDFKGSTRECFKN